MRVGGTALLSEEQLCMCMGSTGTSHCNLCKDQGMTSVCDFCCLLALVLRILEPG